MSAVHSSAYGNSPPGPAYTVLELIGSGGQANVYRALDRASGAEVAMKVLHPHLAVAPDVVERFRREVQALIELRHRHIVRILDVGSGATPYYTMELLRGPNLAQRLHAVGAFHPVEATGVIRQLAQALDHLHQRGIIHRDVKPANIMFNDAGDAMLMDFGIARFFGESSLTGNGTVGTVAAMAPEQIRGAPPTPAVDIYALGVLAYELLAGWPPFQEGAGSTAQILYDIVHREPYPLRLARPGLPEGMYRAVETALAKQPEDRPRTAGEFAARFARLGAQADSSRTSPAPAGPPAVAIVLLVALVSAMVLAIAAGMGGVAVLAPPIESPAATAGGTLRGWDARPPPAGGDVAVRPRAVGYVGGKETPG